MDRRVMFDGSTAVKTALDNNGAAVKSVTVYSDLLFNVEDILQPFGALEQLRAVAADLRRNRFDVVYNGSRWYVGGYTGVLFVLLRVNPVRGHVVYSALVRDIWNALIAESSDTKTEQAYISALLHFSKPKVPIMLLEQAIRDAVKRRAPSYRYEWYKRAVVNYAVAIYFEHPLARATAVSDYGGYYDYRLKSLDFKEVYSYIEDVYQSLASRGSVSLRIAEFGLSKAPEIIGGLLREPLAYLPPLVTPDAIEYVCNAHRTLLPILSASDPDEFRRLYRQMAQDAKLSAAFQLPAIAELWQARFQSKLSEF